VRPSALASLIIAAVAISWASILILLSSANPISISFWRLAIASLTLMPLAMTRPRSIARNNIKWVIISGTGLAVHFITWITSLFYTTVAASTTIVSTYVIFVIPLAYMTGHREVSRDTLISISMAMIGVFIITLSDYGGGLGSIWGDVLALFGSISGAIYFASGKAARETMDTASYGALAYGFGAIIVLLISVPLHIDVLSIEPRSWLYIILLVIGPMLGGHTLLNYSMKYYRSVTVATSTLMEPVGSTIIAYFLLGQRPPPLSYIGMALTLAGTYMIVREETRMGIN